MENRGERRGPVEEGGTGSQLRDIRERRGQQAALTEPRKQHEQSSTTRCPKWDAPDSSLSRNEFETPGAAAAPLRPSGDRMRYISRSEKHYRCITEFRMLQGGFSPLPAPRGCSKAAQQQRPSCYFKILSKSLALIMCDSSCFLGLISDVQVSRCLRSAPSSLSRPHAPAHLQYADEPDGKSYDGSETRFFRGTLESCRKASYFWAQLGARDAIHLGCACAAAPPSSARLREQHCE